jgi:pyruvate dehydrogenase E2 component (dihydrolipoamide acetyltransferase)
MEAGTLVEWLIKPGDQIRRGDVVAVVETQKGAIEIEIFEAGQVEKLLVAVDTKVPVGTPLAQIRTELVRKEPVAALAFPRTEPLPTGSPPSTPAVLTPIPIVLPKPFAGAPVSTSRPRASPSARRLAETCGADLTIIAGSGPGAVITYADVERHIGQAVPAAERKRPRGLDLDAMRAAIAAAMARSKAEIPHYYLEHQVDVAAAEQWLQRQNAARPPDTRLLFGALAIKSVALAVRRFAAFNGFYRAGKFEPSDAVHVGMAIAIRGGGLAAPALHDADRISIDELMSRMRDLVQRMRVGRTRSSEISDSTITVSSLGERGVDALYGIIYPPQVAIVGFGKISVRPWVTDGSIGPRSVISITLSADHRVSDGHAGALFLSEIGKLLQEPDKL